MNSVIRWRVVGFATLALIGSLVLAGTAQSVPIPSTPAQIRPILIGSEAPGPVLKNSSGEDVDLTRVLEQRPTIVVFYRAHW